MLVAAPGDAPHRIGRQVARPSTGERDRQHSSRLDGHVGDRQNLARGPTQSDEPVVLKVHRFRRRTEGVPVRVEGRRQGARQGDAGIDVGQEEGVRAADHHLIGEQGPSHERIRTRRAQQGGDGGRVRVRDPSRAGLRQQDRMHPRLDRRSPRRPADARGAQHCRHGLVPVRRRVDQRQDMPHVDAHKRGGLGRRHGRAARLHQEGRPVIARRDVALAQYRVRARRRAERARQHDYLVDGVTRAGRGRFGSCWRRHVRPLTNPSGRHRRARARSLPGSRSPCTPTTGRPPRPCPRARGRPAGARRSRRRPSG